MPGRPVALPTASAIMAAPPSWRQTVSEIAVVESIERREIALARHAEHVVHAVDDQLVDQDFAAGAHVVLGAQHGLVSQNSDVAVIAQRHRRLDPAILLLRSEMDGRVKPGHDAERLNVR